MEKKVETLPVPSGTLVTEQSARELPLATLNKVGVPFIPADQDSGTVVVTDKWIAQRISIQVKNPPGKELQRRIAEQQAKGVDYSMALEQAGREHPALWARYKEGDQQPTDWVAWFRYVSQDGQPVIAEIRIFPAAGEDPDLPPAQWMADALGVRAEAPKGGITARVLKQIKLPSPWELFEGQQATAVFTHKKRAERGRAGRPDLFYALIASEYVTLLQQGSEQPVAELAENRNLKTAQVRDAISIARNRGLLTPGQQGRIGGQLTPAALALLKEEVKRKKKPKAD